MRRSTFGFLAIVAATAVSLTMSSCCCSRLNTAKEAHGNGRYDLVAEIDADSGATTDECCSQLQLVKGDACFRLASTGVKEQDNYQCAATYLRSGISNTKQWQTGDINLNRAQNYTNLCESLRKLQGMSQGDMAVKLNGEMLRCAEDFLKAEPGSTAAVYFYSSSRFTSMHRCILHPRDCPERCNDLKALIESLDSVKGVADTYKANIDRLRSDIEGSLKPAGCQ
jgi:hypothetical protein